MNNLPYAKNLPNNCKSKTGMSTIKVKSKQKKPNTINNQETE